MRYVLMIILSLLSWQTMADVQKFTLENGLKIIVKEDHRAPVAVSMMWYNVGSADEPGGITGVSHALEHMMFKGTPKYPMGVFSKTVASVGGQENAFTNFDYTAYFEKIAAAQLPISFELEADRMQNLLLDKAEFAKEIKVIQEERRLRTDDNPQALAFERYMAEAHLTDPYHHPVIGWMGDLEQMTAGDVKAWYQSFYAPNNATLVVVGDVDANKVRDLAQLYFGNLQKRPTFVRKQQIEPPALGPKYQEIHAPAQLPMLMFGYTVPSVKTADNKWEPYALEVIASILDAGESSRLAKNLIRGSHIASSADVYYNLYTRYQTQFIFFGTPTQGQNLDNLKAGMLKEIQRLQNEPVSEAELKRVKTQIIAQKTFEKDSIFGQAMELGLLETIGLGTDAADQYTAQIQAITPQQVQQAARRFFTERAITETRLFPQTANKEQQ
ncbi:M16 family metallopeptidase [Legionella dresdenensis]|uniref:M16 family metallopeptidase n=1 Tax=Legionella dresdenensis TaxID=450200 RepID=A0ABV8CFI1_9GAMM